MRQIFVLFSALSLLLSACGKVDVSVITPPAVTPTASAPEVVISAPQPVQKQEARSSEGEPLGELYFFTMTLSSTTGRANYPYQLMRLPGSCVTGLTACPEPESVVPPFPFGSNIRALSWSPDGSVAVYRDSAVPLHKLWSFDPAAGTWTSMFEAAYIDDALSWSPDGNWIVFRTMNEQEKYELYAIRRDGSGLKMLTSLSALPDTGYPYVMDGWVSGNIVLRPDGVEPGQKEQVYVVSLAEGTVQPMPETLADNTHFTPSSDGAWLAYGAYDGESQTYTLFVTGPDGSNPVTLTSFPNETSGVPIVWSPDNNRLAFVQNDAGPGKGSTVHVNVINRDGTGLQEVCRPRDTSGGMMFSPDGKYLLVNSVGGSGLADVRIFIVNLETLEQRILAAPGIVPEMGWFNPSWRR